MVLRSCVSAACFVLAACILAQEPQPAAPKPDQFFSGTVVSYTKEKLTVARTVLGSNSSQRSFKLDGHTEMEGKLKVNARVTVQYVTKDDVDLAVHIVVRTPAGK